MRALFVKIGWVAMARGASAVGSIVLLWAMTRLWTPDQLADYSVVFGYLTILQTLSLLGLGFAVGRDVAADARGAPGHVRAALTVAVASAALLVLALGLSGEALYGGRLRLAFWAASLSLFATGLTSVFDAQMTGTGRFATIAVINATETLIRVIGFAAVALSDGDIVDFLVFVTLVRGAVAAAYLAIPSVRHALRIAPTRGQAAAYMRQAPAFLGTVVVGALIGRLDLLCLSAMVSPAELGVYALAARLYEMALILPATLTMALFPKIARLGAGGEHEFRLFAHRTLAIVAGGAAVVTAVAVAAAGPLISALFPMAYVAAIPSIRILLVAAAMAPVSQILASVIVVRREQSGDLVVLLVSLAALLVTLSLAVPWIGPPGAAIAVLTASFVLMLGRYLVCRPHLLPALPQVSHNLRGPGA